MTQISFNAMTNFENKRLKQYGDILIYENIRYATSILRTAFISISLIVRTSSIIINPDFTNVSFTSIYETFLHSIEQLSPERSQVHLYCAFFKSAINPVAKLAA